MTRLSVAVVIATFNRHASLDRLLADLAEQEQRPDEVVIVDDGSETPAVIPAMVDERLGVTLIRQANAGAAHARHTAIGHVTADVVIVVDDDMSVGPTFVRSHVARHEGGATVVQAPFRNVVRPDTPLFDRFTMRQHDAYFDACTASEAALDSARLTTGNVSFRTELYRRVGGFDTTLRRSEDRELGIRFASAGAVLGFAADAVAWHDEDPEPIETWLRGSRQYGAAELAIARRHPLTLDPWGLFLEIPGAARLVVRGGLRWQRLLPGLVRCMVRTGRAFERAGIERPAVDAYGMAYALAWFQGLFSAFPTPAMARASLDDAIRRAKGPTRVRFGQVGVDVVDMAEAVTRTIDLAASGLGGVVVTPNVDHLVLYSQVEGFASVYDRADLVLADGMPLVLIARMLRLPLREKVSGSDLISPLMGAAAERGIRVFLLGTTPETAARAEAELRARHPALQVVGRASPWYEPHQPDGAVDAAISLIRDSAAQLVIVAFGAPKQEQFLAEYGDRLPAVCFVCCGASLDLVAGTVRRAPAWMSRIGFEWLFRLCLEPRRLWRRYLVRDVGALPIFLGMVMRRLAGMSLVVPAPSVDRGVTTIDLDAELLDLDAAAAELLAREADHGPYAVRAAEGA